MLFMCADPYLNKIFAIMHSQCSKIKVHSRRPQLANFLEVK